jgi:hypothetical protein
MDTTALATALVGAKAAEVQMAFAAKMLRMNADAAKSVVQVIEAAQENLNRLANVAAGTGGNLDISV